ncbi:MAG: phage major capsid protein [Clostridia bacterium]|nr:phage major capsid protein [Clostridia bacterium]
MSYFDNIRLEKGMYNSGRGLTEILEELDPSENYKGSSMEGLDAFQRQLKRFDIKVGGSHSDPVMKFFETSDSAALFPEYVARAVKQGIDSSDRLRNIVATKTIINGMDYRSVVSEPANGGEMNPVAEGAILPGTSIRTSDNLVKLQKRGRMLVASYEAIKYQRLDLFTVMLRQIGAHIAREQLKDAVDVIVNGDGNNNAASTVSLTTAGTLTYGDLIKLWAGIAPYELNAMLAPTDMMQKLMALTEMKDAVAGLTFQGTGKMITPLGAQLLHIPSMTSGSIIGLDKNCALEMVQSGNIVMDSDKLIDRQLERTTISCIAGFAKIVKDASKILA